MFRTTLEEVLAQIEEMAFHIRDDQRCGRVARQIEMQARLSRELLARVKRDILEGPMPSVICLGTPLEVYLRESDVRETLSFLLQLRRPPSPPRSPMPPASASVTPSSSEPPGTNARTAGPAGRAG